MVKEKKEIGFIGAEECGREIGNHLSLVNSYKSINQPLLDSNPPSSTVNVFPLNFVVSDNTEDNALTSFSAFGGCMIKTMMPEYSLGGNKMDSATKLITTIDNL